MILFIIYLLLSFLFVSYVPSSLNELNQNPPHTRKWVRYKNACPKSWVSHALQSGAQSYVFWRLCNIMATLAANVFGTKHDIHNRASALETARHLLHCIKISWISVHKRLKIGPLFYPPSVNSANGTQPNFAKRWTGNRGRKVGIVRPKNSEPKNFTLLSFGRLQELMANILWMKHHIAKRAMMLESTRGALHYRKISWTSIHKRLKIGPEFLPTFSILFRPHSPVHLSGINVAPHGECKWNGIGFVCSLDLKPQNILIWQWLTSGCLKWKSNH